MSIKGHNSVANLRKMTIHNPNEDLVNDNVYIPTSIKGRNSVTNLRKMTTYNPNVDLVKYNVYTKFG